MSPLIIVNYIISGICLSIGLLHLAIFIRQTHRKTELLFSIMCMCIALSAMPENVMYSADTSDVYRQAFKIQLGVHAVLWIAFVWFTVFYTQTVRRSMAVAVTAGYCLAFVINFISPHGVIFSRIEGLKQEMLPWGETIVFAVGTASSWRYVADATWALMLYMTVEACIRLGRRGDARRAAVFGGSLFLTIGLAYLHGTLVDFGVLPPPTIFHISFLALVLFMSAILTADVVKAAELATEVVANEQRWSALMENIKLLVVGVDQNGRIDYVNPHFCRITEYSEAELLGKSLFDLAVPEETEDLRQRFQMAMAGEIRPHVTRQFLTKSGRIRQINWSHVINRNTRQQIIGTLSIGEDVTELKTAQKALAEEKDNMDVILSALHTGLALLDTDLNVVWVNAKTRQALGMDDLVGKKCYQVAENRSEPCENCGALQAIREGRIFETERLNTMNQRWYHIVSVPIKDDKDRVVNVLESSTDITERKQVEAERDGAIQALQAFKIKLEEENIYLQQELESEHGFTEIVGQSNPILYVLEKVRQVSQTDASVLVMGETGVGKELIARAIHRTGSRGEKPLIKVNCATLPENLVESELFGHEAGAFTGAKRLRKGRFELADGGTIFLDEISELPFGTQNKLLRVLQEGQFERVGSSVTISVDVRVIAATNRNLNEEVAAGRFRPDLFYRLNVYPITVPPLRDRRKDIPLLVNHFVNNSAKRIGKKIDQIPTAVMETMQAYYWPGNVRELINVIERAVITSSNSVLLLPEQLESQPGDRKILPKENAFNLTTLESVERQHIVDVLDATGWRISGDKGAAKILDINPSTLRFRMKKLGIRK